MIGGVQKSTYWTCRMSFPSRFTVYYCHRSRQFQLGWSFHRRSSMFQSHFFYLALAAIRCILHLKVQDSQGGGLSWACMFRYWLEIQPLNTLGFDLQDSVQDLDMIKGNWDLNQPFGCSGNSKPAGGVWDTQKPTVFIVHPIGVFRGMFVIHLGACCCSPSGFCCSRWMPVAFDAFTEIGADDKQPGHWAVMGAAAW